MYTEKIYNVMTKYGISDCYPKFNAFLFARSVIVDIVSKLKETTLTLIGTSKIDIRMTMECLDDDQAIEPLSIEIENITDFDYQSLKKKTILIVSLNGSREISKQLFENEIPHISLYDELVIKGMIIDHNFYDFWGSSWVNYKTLKESKDPSDFDICYEIHQNKFLYKHITDHKLKTFYLERLIFLFLYAKDFILFHEYIGIYISTNAHKKQNYQNAKIEIDLILESFRNTIASRNQPDLLIHILDSLEYGEDSYMPFLLSKTHNSVSFERAYTTTPYTHSTLKALFLKKYVVDDKAFLIDKITLDNSAILNLANSIGYKVRYFGFSQTFDDSIKSRKFISMHSTFSQIVWSAYEWMATIKAPALSIIHEVFESHYPYKTANCDSNYFVWREPFPGEITPDIEPSKQNSLSHLDRQLAFYNSFISKSATSIYMSDHGHTKFGRFHPILKIISPYIKNVQIWNLFSYINFDHLLRDLIQKSDSWSPELFSNEFVKIQDSDYYFGLTISRSIDRKFLSPDSLLGYKGIITDEEFYLIYNNGFEVYFTFKKMFISKERLDFLRAKVDQAKPIEHSKFAYSNYIYRIIENHNKRLPNHFEHIRNKLIELMNSIAPSKTIALRSGGQAALNFLLMIGPENQRKIKFIIDSNLNCIAGYLGPRVISINSILDNEIDTILIPSKPLSNLFKDELSKFNIFSVLDIHEYLANNGITTKDDFFKYDFVESDFSVNFPFNDFF